MAMAMAMAENETLLVSGGPGSVRDSPWKKPETAPAESPVMGVKMWPSLSDVQRTNKTFVDVSVADSQVAQISNGHKKSSGGGSRNSSHKNGQQRNYKGGSKRNQNVPPPFPVPLVPHVYPPGVPVLRPIPGHAYGYPPIRAPFPGADNPSGKSGSQAPVKAFGPQLHAMDASQNIQPPAPGDLDDYAPKHSVGKTNAAVGGGPGGHMYRLCQHPWPFGPKGGIMVPQNMPPRAYMRPAFFGLAPFVGGPPFPGPGHMHYRPNLPPGSIRPPFPPRFAPQLVNPLVPVLLPNPLRESIVKQIEYYFSDDNLLTDSYLISQMDDQGWVPISIIVDFKRVKSMCTDTLFILDALQSSRSVEVQGKKVRKRDRPLKYAVVTPSEHKMVSSPGVVVENNFPSEERADSTFVGNTGSLSESDSKVDVSSDRDTFGIILHDMKVDGSVDSAVVTNLAVDETVALQTGYKQSDIGSLPANDSSSDTDSKIEGTVVLSGSAA